MRLARGPARGMGEWPFGSGAGSALTAHPWLTWRIASWKSGPRPPRRCLRESRRRLGVEDGALRRGQATGGARVGGVGDPGELDRQVHVDPVTADRRAGVGRLGGVELHGVAGVLGEQEVHGRLGVLRNSVSRVSSSITTFAFPARETGPMKIA